MTPLNCSNCGRTLEARDYPARCALCGFETQPDSPSFESRIAPFLGKTLLFGLTYVDADERPLRYEQYSGEIEKISTADGVVVRLHDSDETYRLPPALNQLKPARPGEYRLKLTGKVIVNPDFLATWSITQTH